MAEFEHLEELVIGLFDRGELGYAKTKDKFIQLKSGRLSPNFFNGRGIMSFSTRIDMPLDKQKRLAGLMVESYSHGLDQAKNPFDHIINLPQAVNPIVGAVALLRGVSLLYLRTPEGEKSYGKHSPIEGQYQIGDSVIGLDNVISNADTKIEAAKPIEGVGLVLPEFVVLLDREEGGEVALKAQGYDLTRVAGMGVATRILLDAGRIQPHQAEWSFEYNERYNTFMDN